MGNNNYELEVEHNINEKVKLIRSSWLKTKQREV